MIARPSTVIAAFREPRPVAGMMDGRLQRQVTSIVALDAGLALRAGAGCASAGSADVVDASVAICASDRGHPVITGDPGDVAAIDPALTLILSIG